MTLGTFDLLHPGHVALFRECRKLAGPGGKVVVAVNRDGFVARFKHKTPVLSCDERMEIIRAVRYVDEVVDNTGEHQHHLIESFRPDWLAIGVDWATRDYYAQLDITPAWLAERRISLVYLAHEASTVVSTTKLRHRMADTT